MSTGGFAPAFLKGESQMWLAFTALERESFDVLRET
jgi:hypothetical protein